MSIEHRDIKGADRAPAAPPRLPVKPCGDCSLCCTVLAVHELSKPCGQRCDLLAEAGGCSVHATRPGACRSFQCFWTLSTVLDEAWKPDRSGLVLWSNIEGRLIVEVDAARPESWRKEPYLGQLQAWADRSQPLHLEVFVRIGGRMSVLFPEGAIDLGAYDPDLAVDSGYLNQDGASVPYARYVEPQAATI